MRQLVRKIVSILGITAYLITLAVIIRVAAEVYQRMPFSGNMKVMIYSGGLIFTVLFVTSVFILIFVPRHQHSRTYDAGVIDETSSTPAQAEGWYFCVRPFSARSR